MFQVDLTEPTAVTGIVTQGASRLGTKMWVTSYQIQYSKDRHNYKTVRENGVKKVMCFLRLENFFELHSMS